MNQDEEPEDRWVVCQKKWGMDLDTEAKEGWVVVIKKEGDRSWQRTWGQVGMGDLLRPGAWGQVGGGDESEDEVDQDNEH